jgi:hypothetical protein
MYNEKNYFTFNYNHLYIFRISQKEKTFGYAINFDTSITNVNKSLLQYKC